MMSGVMAVRKDPLNPKLTDICGSEIAPALTNLDNRLSRRMRSAFSA